jgi:hypothetical protein
VTTTNLLPGRECLAMNRQGAPREPLSKSRPVRCGLLRLQSGCGCGFYSIFLSMDCSCSSPNSCNSVGLQPAEHALALFVVAWYPRTFVRILSLLPPPNSSSSMLTAKLFGEGKFFTGLDPSSFPACVGRCLCTWLAQPDNNHASRKPGRRGR